MGGVSPMMAALAPAPFDSERHLFEPKWDGVRCIAYVSEREVHLVGRSGKEITGKFPELDRSSFRTSTGLVLDGEIFCGEGTTRDFPLIQGRVHKQDIFDIKLASLKHPATLSVFDVLEVNGVSVARQPLWVRKQLLNDNLADGERVMQTLFLEGKGIAMFEAMAARGYEGVMAKHRESPYVPGKRSPSWQKMKVGRSGIFLAVGLTQGQGWREGTFGALVLASKEEGRLVHRGEVGTGFSNGDLLEVLAIAKDAPGYGFSGKGVRWIEPIECRVKFLDTTADGKLRFPSFKGLAAKQLL